MPPFKRKRTGATYTTGFFLLQSPNHGASLPVLFEAFLCPPPQKLELSVGNAPSAAPTSHAHWRFIAFRPEFTNSCEFACSHNNLMPSSQADHINQSHPVTSTASGPAPCLH